MGRTTRGTYKVQRGNRHRRHAQDSLRFETDDDRLCSFLILGFLVDGPGPAGWVRFLADSHDVATHESAIVLWRSRKKMYTLKCSAR